SSALLCLRDPAATLSIPEQVRAGAFAETDPEVLRRLAGLKERVRASGHTVLDGYSCAWDPDAQRLVGLEEFGDRVRDWLWEAIRSRLGLLDAPPTAGDGG